MRQICPKTGNKSRIFVLNQAVDNAGGFLSAASLARGRPKPEPKLEEPRMLGSGIQVDALSDQQFGRGNGASAAGD